MTDKDTVSVIIPAYNAARTLANCLEGIKNSDLKPLETIVVDDRSKDRTVEIAKTFPCTVIELERNSGQAKARNTGAAKASGCDYLFFVDSDIVLYPDTIGRLLRVLKENDNRAVVSAVYNPQVKGLSFFGKYKNLYSCFKWRLLAGRTTLLNSSAAIVRADVFRQAGGFNEKLRAIEDADLGSRIAAEHEVWLDINSEVIHLKSHAFMELVKDTFIKGYYHVLVVFRRKLRVNARDAGGFQIMSFPFTEMINFFVGFAIILNILATIATLGGHGLSLLCLLGYFWLSRYNYVKYLFKEGGALFGAGAMLYMILESVVCFFALVWGALLWTVGAGLKRNES